MKRKRRNHRGKKRLIVRSFFFFFFFSFSLNAKWRLKWQQVNTALHDRSRRDCYQSHFLAKKKHNLLL